MPTSSEWRIEGECTRCAACCRHMRHPLMCGEDGSTCKYLDDDGSGPTACPIKLAWLGKDLPAGRISWKAIDATARAYWESECKDFPQLSQDGEPLTDADCRSLAEHLRDIRCEFRVVRRG